MKKYFFIVLIVICFPLLSIISCNSKNDYSDIAGKWYYTENPDINVEFFSDNSLRYNEIGNSGLAGAWSFLDDGRLKIEISKASGSKVIGLGTFSEDELTLDVDGSKIFVQSTMNISEYFPLKTGYKYIYKVTEYNENMEPIESSENKTITEEILTDIDIDGIAVTPVVMEDGGNKFTYHYSSKPDGIFLTKIDIDLKDNDISADINAYVIRHPIRNNVTWTHSRKDKNSSSESVCTIENTNELVDTGSSVYKNCIRISSLTNTKNNSFSQKYKYTIWLAPNIGKVKFQNEIETESGQHKDTVISIANLESFTK